MTHPFRWLATTAVLALLASVVTGLVHRPDPQGSTRTATTSSSMPISAVLDTADFAGGCFWGVEGVFEHVKGVVSATAGYAGGSVESPTYEEVSSGATGHAESVQVIYDPAVITYADLLQVFFRVATDPTQLNRQGPDVGTQYRSAVFYRSSAQQHAAESYVAELERAKVYSAPIVTQIVPLKAFYPAENYHQHYMALNPDSPYIRYNDAPKLVALQKEFPAWYKAS